MFPSLKRGIVDVFLVAAPKVVAGATTLLVNVVLLRYFGPEQFAIYSLCVTGILLTDAILGAAVDMGILRMQQAGVIPVSYSNVAVEILADNAAPEAEAVYAALSMPFSGLVFGLRQYYSHA